METLSPGPRSIESVVYRETQNLHGMLQALQEEGGRKPNKIMIDYEVSHENFPLQLAIGRNDGQPFEALTRWMQGGEVLNIRMTSEDVWYHTPDNPFMADRLCIAHSEGGLLITPRTLAVDGMFLEGKTTPLVELNITVVPRKS